MSSDHAEPPAVGDRELNRRNVLVGGTTLAAAPALRLMSAHAAMADAKPNIVFILADDLGYPDVSCYGRRDFSTPNIDRIAARGVRFLQGYGTSLIGKWHLGALPKFVPLKSGYDHFSSHISTRFSAMICGTRKVQQVGISLISSTPTQST